MSKVFLIFAMILILTGVSAVRQRGAPGPSRWFGRLGCWAIGGSGLGTRAHPVVLTPITEGMEAGGTMALMEEALAITDRDCH